MSRLRCNYRRASDSEVRHCSQTRRVDLRSSKADSYSLTRSGVDVSYDVKCCNNMSGAHKETSSINYVPRGQSRHSDAYLRNCRPDSLDRIR